MTRAHKSPVYTADTTELRKLGTDLQTIIDAAMESALKVHNTIYDLDWLGKTRDASLDRADRELVQDRRVGEVLHTLANAYINGADTMQPMITTLRNEGQALEADGFSVSELWEVKDTYTYDSKIGGLASLYGIDQSQIDTMRQERATRAANANARLQPLADQLGTADENTRAAIANAAAELDTAAPARAGMPHVILADNEKHTPTIDGTGTDPKLEQDGYDLGATIPDDPSVLLYGDPDTGKNGLKFADGGRPIPTGTAVGPDGKKYGFYSDAQGDVYVSPQATVVDLADPSKSLGALKDKNGTNIGQASGVYDPKTNTMWICGNVNGKGARGLWQSAPIDPSNPNGWITSLESKGTFSNAMNGNQENQIVALKSGGFFLAGAADRVGVLGAAASSPGDLLNAAPRSLAGLIPSPDPGQTPGYAYGPSIVGTQILPNGQEQVTLRISTWDIPVGWEQTPQEPVPPYAPRTYIKSVDINP